MYLSKIEHHCRLTVLRRKMSVSTEFSKGNLINVSTQNNFCGYYVLARRIINDDNFVMILDHFNQFYQTNWYPDQLAEVIKNMHPQQADIMLGLVIYDKLKKETVDTHRFQDLCNDFGYDLSLFQYAEVELASIFNLAEFAPLQDKQQGKIFVLLHLPKGDAIGHYHLLEPDADKVTEYKQKCSPDVDHAYEINNCGGIDFVENIKKSVTEIKPNWTLELKNRQIQEDKIFAWKLAAEEARRAGLTFFTSEHTISNEEKTHLRQLQSERWLIFQTE